MNATRPFRPLRRRPLTAAIALLLGGAYLPAAAQEAEADDGTQLDTVVVSATRRDESLQDVPINVTAVSGQEIERQGLKDLADLVRAVPGLYLVDQGGRDSNLLTVRGLNVNSLSASEGVGNDGGGVVAQYIGDIPLYLDLRLLDIDRVETLLGPQGTLYGSGTLGGAIRYLPNRPQLGQTSLEVSTGVTALSHSSGTGNETTLIGNLPVGEKGAFRAAVGYFDDPGFIDYGYLIRQPGVSNPQPDPDDPIAVSENLRREKDANFQRTLSGRLAFRYAFTDAVEANLSYFYQDQKSGGRTINHVEAFGTGRYTSASRFLEPNDRSNELLALELTADLGFATLTSASGYSKYDEDGQRDQTDLLLSFEYGYEDFPSFAAYTHERAEEKRYNQELRLVSNSEGPLDWIVGVFYNKSDLDATSAEFVPGIPEFMDIDRPDNLEYFQATYDTFTEKAVFGEIGYDLTDQWNVTVGGRWFEFKDDQKVGFALPLIDGSAPDEILLDYDPVKVSDRDHIFKFNTSYRFDERLLGYFTLSEGYRTGGSNAVPTCEDPLPPGQNVCALPNERLIKPDKTTNHEIGLRSSWFDGSLILNGALYMIDWEDIQVAGTTVNGAIPITVNAAEARSQGVELSAQARLSPNWRLTGSYTYNKAELTRDAPAIVSGEDAFDGDRLPGSPEHQANATLSYLRPLGDGMSLGIDYGVSAQSDVYTRVGLRNDGEILGGYAIHNIAANLYADRWTLRFYVRNLFDKYAETGVRNTYASIRDIEGDGTSFRLRSYYHSVLEPMRVGVSVSYTF